MELLTKKLVQLITESNIPLIEDDIYGDLGFQTRPETCKAYDTNGNVILCSSFSKTLAPGLRVGWIAPGKYYDQVIKMKTLLKWIGVAAASGGDQCRIFYRFRIFYCAKAFRDIRRLLGAAKEP